MKRPTINSKAWNKRHAQLQFKRKLEHKRYCIIQNRKKSHFSSETTVVNNTRYKSIECPPLMSLAKNISGVTQVLNRIRKQSTRQRNEKTYIDFKPIREISPGAALVLAAELDRWNHRFSKNSSKLQAIDVEKWDRNVCSRLRGMGFFKLLRVNETSHMEEHTSNIKFMNFRTGAKVDGKAIEELRTVDLEPFIGDSVPNRFRLYAAVAEAMTNVVHHAYDKSMKRRPNWWLSASHDISKGELRILLYDQGAGIPATLPRKFSDRLFGLWKSNVSDSEMIKIAHELAETSTREAHRGHGLERDVRKYVESVDCRSAYRITSSRGEYTWTKNPNGKIKESMRNLSQPLRGTLIEWRLTLQ